MSIVTTIAHSLQSLLGPSAEEVARQVPVVQRRRKSSPATLAQTLIFGFLAKPHASDEELARTAAQCGVAVSTQAVERRFTDTMAAFLEALFGNAVCHGVPAERTPAPLVERFPAVILQDSTSITPPDALRDRFPGCGGSYGGGRAAMRLQVQLDLRSGALARSSTAAIAPFSSSVSVMIRSVNISSISVPKTVRTADPTRLAIGFVRGSRLPC